MPVGRGSEEAGMGRTQEPGGDYGYDLAHEDVEAQAARRAPDAGDLPAPAHTGDDPTGDYAYDEAHDF
jgi:hypothetical protein